VSKPSVQILLVVADSIFLVAGTIGGISNLTTGITIAHTGYTVNKNVTSSLGLAPLLQLYPFMFAFGMLLAIGAYGYSQGWFDPVSPFREER